MKKQIYYLGISTTLMLLVAELTYINAKSLLYLVAEFGVFDKIFAVIGTMAFSMVTVLVMRTTSSRWMRIVFPLFDSVLVFCGFNLKFAGNLLDNPIAFGLTVFMAIFTGFIMYGLGRITYEKQSGVDIESKRIIDELTQKLNESNRINSETNEKLIESNRIIDDLKKKLAETTRINSETKHMAENFLRNHILYEAWMSKKKSEQNRNGYDAMIADMAERIKAGDKVALDEYLSKVKH